MFTGTIKAVSKVKNSRKEADSLFLEIEKPANFHIDPGSSIATNGVCLTVREVLQESYFTELMKTTLERTSFGKHVPERVNLEPSLKAGDPVDGHFVMGHVDTIGTIKKIEKGERSWNIVINYPNEFSELVVLRGSITVNGVSLTVVDCEPGEFSVHLVDYSINHTTFPDLEVGDTVNIEFDMLGKYLLNKEENKK